MHTVTFKINKPKEPFWKQLGYNTVEEYNNSLIWIATFEDGTQKVFNISGDEYEHQNEWK